MDDELLITTGQVTNNELRPFSSVGSVDVPGEEPCLNLGLHWGSPQLRRRGIVKVRVDLTLRPRDGGLRVRCVDAHEDDVLKVDAPLGVADVTELILGDRTDTLGRLLLSRGINGHPHTVLTCILVADLDAAMHKVRVQWGTLRERFASTAALLGQW